MRHRPLPELWRPPKPPGDKGKKRPASQGPPVSKVLELVTCTGEIPAEGGA